MELHELLSKTQEDIIKLPLIDQMTYWTWYYEESIRNIKQLINAQKKTSNEEVSSTNEEKFNKEEEQNT